MSDKLYFTVSNVLYKHIFVTHDSKVIAKWMFSPDVFVCVCVCHDVSLGDLIIFK